MKKVKAFFNGLASPNTSEFWMMWSGVALSLLCKIDAVCGVITGMAGALKMTPEAFVGGMVIYAIGRMGSKAAKA